jgi:hypothetical protein
MNPYRLKDVFNYLTSNNQLLKRKLKLGTDDIPIPPKRDDVTTIEAINRFNKANPRVDTTNLKPLSVKHSKVKQSNVGEADEGTIQSAFDTATREAQFEGYPAPSYEKFKSRYLKKNMKADGGMLVQPSDDGSRPGYAKDDKRGTLKAGKFSSESIDNVSDAFLKSYANDDIQILFEKNKTNPNGLISAKDSKAGIFTKITTNENYLQAIVKNTGLDKETILNMIEDRDAFTALEKTVSGQDTRFADRKKFVTQAEKWLLNNGKRYADPVKFEKAFARTFGKNNLITKTIRANIMGARVAGRPTISFSADFVSDTKTYCW